jgi:16S rRNA G527 N7-methylase RsmG
VACARLEDLGSEREAERAELVFVRAVGDLERILDLASVVARPGGRWVYFLGSKSAEESLRNPEAHGARVEEGAFGGRLLTGVFAQ